MTELDSSGRDIAASVRARLLDQARAEELDLNLLITRLCAGTDAPRPLLWGGVTRKILLKFDESKPMDTIA